MFLEAQTTEPRVTTEVAFAKELHERAEPELSAPSRSNPN